MTVVVDGWIVGAVGIGMTVFYLTGLLLAGHALMKGRTTQGTIAWVMGLVLFPYVTVFLYAFLGYRRFSGYLRRRQEGEAEVAQLSNQIVVECDLAASVVPLEDLDPALRAACELVELPVLGGNKTTILIDGEAIFADILSGIAKAKDYVLVQFFIIRDDELGHRLADALKERASAGCAVYLLYDEVGSVGTSNAFFADLRQCGVNVSGFGLRRSWNNRFRVNFRNHRKIVVVDGCTAWIGGANVGVEYLGLDPKMGAWRDTHLRVDGPATLGAQMAFAEDWQWSTGAIPAVTWTKPAPAGEEAVLVFPTGPADAVETGVLLRVQAINSAVHRIWIASPYFVPTDALLSALLLAVRRGVDVRFLLPDKSDHLMPWLASRTYIADLVPHGVRFFAHSAGFLHQKVVLVDDTFASVGTSNFDPRSLVINFEVDVGLLDPASVGEVAAMLERDLANCHEIDDSVYRERSFPYRIACRAARLFSPLL